MYFGDNFLEVLKTLRSSLFLSVLLGNCEIWQNITKAEIKSIEAADHSLLTQCLGLSKKSSYCLILLDRGLLPLRFHLVMRRLGYLQSLLKKGNDELSKMIFMCQIQDTKKQMYRRRN